MLCSYALALALNEDMSHLQSHLLKRIRATFLEIPMIQFGICIGKLKVEA